MLGSRESTLYVYLLSLLLPPSFSARGTHCTLLVGLQGDITALQRKLTKAKSDKAHYAKKQAEEEDKLEMLQSNLETLEKEVEDWTAEVVRPLLLILDPRTCLADHTTISRVTDQGPPSASRCSSRPDG